MTYEQQLHQADCDLAARSVTAEELAMLRHHFAKTRATNPIKDHSLHWKAIRSYKAKDWFLNVTGRGDIAFVSIPESEELPVKGEKVEIDGKERIVSSVELMKDNFGRRTEVGLVLRDVIELTPNPTEWCRERWTAPEDGAYSLNGILHNLRKGDGFPPVPPKPFPQQTALKAEAYAASKNE